MGIFINLDEMVFGIIATVQVFYKVTCKAWIILHVFLLCLFLAVFGKCMNSDLLRNQPCLNFHITIWFYSINNQQNASSCESDLRNFYHNFEWEFSRVISLLYILYYMFYMSILKFAHIKCSIWNWCFQIEF